MRKRELGDQKWFAAAGHTLDTKLHVDFVDVLAVALKQPEWQLSGFGQLKFNMQGSQRTVTQFRLLLT